MHQSTTSLPCHVLLPLLLLLLPQAPGSTPQGAAYRLIVSGPDGFSRLIRRDPWARSAETASSWCFVHNPAAYTWKNTQWQPYSYDKVGSGYQAL